MCLKNGDWSYNQEYEDLSAGAIEQQNHIYFASPIVRVNFTSTQTWGSEFPAGTSLNGVLMCYTATPDEYIRSGYRRNLESLREKMKEVTEPLARAFWQEVLEKTRGDQTPIVGRFSEIDFRKYRLVGRRLCIFYLSSLITPPKEQT